MSGAWAWVWKYVLLCFSFKFWECVDRAYVRWKIVESVWGKIKWGWLKERSVRYSLRELKRSSLSECASCARFGERGVQKVFGGSFMCKLKAQEGSLVLSPRLQLLVQWHGLRLSAASDAFAWVLFSPVWEIPRSWYTHVTGRRRMSAVVFACRFEELRLGHTFGSMRAWQPKCGCSETDLLLAETFI